MQHGLVKLDDRRGGEGLHGVTRGQSLQPSPSHTHVCPCRRQSANFTAEHVVSYLTVGQKQTLYGIEWQKKKYMHGWGRIQK